MTIFKCVDRVVRKRSPAYTSMDDILKQEKEYRTKYIYGDKKYRVCYQTSKESIYSLTNSINATTSSTVVMKPNEARTT